MDLRSIGAAHLGSANVNSMNLLGGNMAARERNPVDLQSFEEVLRNAATRNAPAQTSAPTAGAATAPVMSAVRPEAPRSAPVGVTIDRDSELFQQCLELETFLIKKLLNSMRSTIQRSGLIEQSFAGEMYEDMLFDKRARHLAENAGFGLAEMAYLELTGQRGRVVLR